MSLENARVAAQAASAKTLEETVILDVGEIIAITDHFVIASGRNDRQVRAIVDEVGRRLREAGVGPPRQSEGLKDATWILLDYGDFVVHIFGADAREFYSLERLWSDAERVSFESELASS